MEEKVFEMDKTRKRHRGRPRRNWNDGIEEIRNDVYKMLIGMRTLGWEWKRIDEMNALSARISSNAWRLTKQEHTKKENQNSHD